MDGSGGVNPANGGANIPRKALQEGEFILKPQSVRQQRDMLLYVIPFVRLVKEICEQDLMKYRIR